MKAVGGAPGELTVEERNLLSVAYKNAVGSRRASWRIISSVEQKEQSKGNDANVGHAKAYRAKVEAELQGICDHLGFAQRFADSAGQRCRVKGLLPQDEGRLLPLHCRVHRRGQKDWGCQQCKDGLR